MKKIIALSALMILVSSSAFAEGLVVDIPAGGAIKGQKTSPASEASLGKLSTNVSITVFSGTTAFSALTKHLSGNRAFGTASTDTRIYYLEKDAGVLAKDAFTLTKSDSSDFTTGNGWSSL